MNSNRVSSTAVGWHPYGFLCNDDEAEQCIRYMRVPVVMFFPLGGPSDFDECIDENGYPTAWNELSLDLAVEFCLN